MITGKIFVLFLVFIFSSSVLFPQSDSVNSVVKGSVANAKEQKLQDVTVSVINIKTLEIYRGKSNTDGNFEIIIPDGQYRITAVKEGFISFEDYNFEVKKAQSKTINITLTEKLYSTDEIDVEGNLRQNQNDLRTSLFNVSPTSIKILPGGLEDVMRSLKSLPGVSAPNDFTSQLIVRGSGPDQNLIIMDEVEIFNPYRLYGLVSMFNPETISDIILITGGFPAKYGDRLSAVLDVTNKEGERNKPVSLLANINIANANIVLQGRNPFNIPGSWLVSTRRTYYDLILGPFARNSGLITDNSSFPSFEDLQFKIAVEPFQKSKFVINGIFSKDAVDIIPGAERTDPDSVNVIDATINNVLSAGWHYNPNSRFVSKTTFSWYRNSGDNAFDGDILDPLIDKENLTPQQRDSLKAIGALLGFKFKSKYDFRKFSLVNRSVYIQGKNKYEFGGGADIIRNDLTYTLDLDDQFKAFLNSFPNGRALLQDFSINGKDNYRGSLYGMGRFEIGRNYFVQPSLRVDYYSILQRVYFSPRINFGYAINQLTTLRFSTGIYYQSPGYEKLIDNQTFYDLNNVQNENLKAESAIHFVIGLDRWLNSEWQLRVEGYYKKFDNLIVQQKLTGYKYQFYLIDPYNTDPNYIKNPLNWVRSDTKLPYDSMTAIPVNDGTGNAFGIEFSLEKKYTGPNSRLYGWINYSISSAMRQRDGFEYPFRFDQMHVVNLVLNYRVNSWFEIGARWSYASNFPFTSPVGITPRIVNDSLVVNPFTNKVVFNLDYGGESNRNADKKPEYHRLDVRFTAFANFWSAEWSFYLDVINVYNRKNVLGYDYSLNSNLVIKRETMGMFPILPTLGICARF